MNNCKRRALAVIIALSLVFSQQTSLLGLQIVKADNTAPVADFTIDPATGNTTTQFTFDGSVSIDAEDPIGDLEVRWDFEYNGDPGEPYDTGFVLSKTVAYTYAIDGVKTIRMEVRDTEGLTDSVQKQLTVNPAGGGNQAPTASFTVTPDSGDLTTTFSFDASASSDPEDNPVQLEVRWDFDGDNVYDTNFSNTKQIQHQYTASGNFQAKMEVRDTGGLLNDTTRPVSVAGPNQAPTAHIVVFPPTMTGTTATTFQFDASSSSDPEDPIGSLEARWDFEDDGTYDTNFSTTKTSSKQYGTIGTKTIRLEIRDTGGLTGTTTVQVEVTVAPPENQPPTAFFDVAPQSGTTVTQFSFDASASSDPEDGTGVGSQIEVRWDFDNDGTYETSFTTAKTVVYTYATPNTYTATVEARDTGGLTNAFSRQIVVAAAGGGDAPVADFTFSPDSGDTNTLFTFDASNSFDDRDGTGFGSLLQAKWDFDGDGIYDTTYSLTKIVTYEFSVPYNYNVVLMVKDTDGNTDTIVKQLAVAPSVLGERGTSRSIKRLIYYKNNPPRPDFSISSKNGDGENALIDEEIKFDASLTEDDKDPIGRMMYRWDFDGDGEFDTLFSGNNMQTGYVYDFPGLKFVSLEVWDSYGAIASVTKLLAVSEQLPEVPEEQIELDQPAAEKAPAITPTMPSVSKKQTSAPVATLGDSGRHSFYFAPYVLNKSLRHGESTTITTIFKNLSNETIYNVRISETQMAPTNGGSILRDNPRFTGSSFIPRVLSGSVLGGDIVIEQVPPHSTMKISYDVIASTSTVPDGETSHIGSMFHYKNGSESFINSILLDNTAQASANDISADSGMLAMSLAPLALASRRRKEEEDELL